MMFKKISTSPWIRYIAGWRLHRLLCENRASQISKAESSRASLSGGGWHLIFWWCWNDSGWKMSGLWWTGNDILNYRAVNVRDDASRVARTRHSCQRPSTSWLTGTPAVWHSAQSSAGNRITARSEMSAEPAPSVCLLLAIAGWRKSQKMTERRITESHYSTAMTWQWFGNNAFLFRIKNTILASCFLIDSNFCMWASKNTDSNGWEDRFWEIE